MTNDNYVKSGIHIMWIDTSISFIVDENGVAEAVSVKHRREVRDGALIIRAEVTSKDAAKK